jgi:hypothetical protein
LKRATEYKKTRKFSEISISIKIQRVQNEKVKEFGVFLFWRTEI